MPERALSAAVLAAIAAGTVRPFLLYEGEYLSGGSPAFLRLFTGVGTLSWDGKDWIGGRDLLAISPIRESTSLEAIGFSVRLSGLPADKLSLFLQSMRKNKAGRLWLGFVGREVVESGTAQAGAADTLTLAAGASSEVNAHARKILSLATGPGSVQELEVASYDGTSKVATVSPRWRTNKMKNSNQITASGWSLFTSGTGSLPVRTANAGIDPEGNLTADRVDFALNGGTTTTDRSDLIQQVAAAAGVPTIQDMWLKTTDGSTKTLRSDFDGQVPDMEGFNVANFVVTGEWQRFAVGINNPSPTSSAFYLRLRGSLGTSDSASVYIWHSKREDASDLGDYIETEAAAITLPDATTGYEVIDENGIIADPYPLRRGRFDVAPITRDPGSGTVTIEARYEGPLARLLVSNVRHYTHEDQQLRLAGDKGFDQVEALQDTQDLWGPEVPVYPVTSRSPRTPYSDVA
jgi:hypothetical protein